MATVVNFIDTTLQAAATRTVNAVNANVLLDASTNAFHVNGSGANDPASITFTYSLIELDGPATFAITGGTLTTSGNVATLTYANMSGSTASVTASVTVNGVTFTSNPRFITKVLDGAAGVTASLLTLASTGQAITFNGLGVATPASQIITFTANLQNLTGTATFTCAKFNAAGTSLGTVTLGGSGNTRTLTDAQFATSAYAITTASLGGFSDTITVVRLADGAGGVNGTSAMAGYLTNEAVTVPSAADGSGAVLTGVTGNFKVFQGTTDVTAGCTFAVVGTPLVTTAAPTTATGAYSVTGLGTWSNASLTTNVTYRATHTASGATIDQLLTITKAPAGASVTGSRGAGQYFATGSVWSDATADAATPGANIAGDVVTISNGTTFVGVKGYSGSAWVPVSPTYDGGAIFPGTVTVNQINANSLVLRDAAGNPLVGLGVPLAAGLEAPGTKNSDIVVGGRNLYTRTTPLGDIGPSGGTGSVVNSRSASGFTITGVTANTGAMRMNPIITKNGDYTISFDLRVNVSAGFPLTIDVCDGASQSINPTLTTTHFSLTFTVANYSAGANNFIDFNGLSGQAYTFTNFSVREGNKDIGWTPAPEDVAADTATAQTAADTANTAINDAATGLAAKLSRTSASSLAATVTVTTGGSILSGTTTNGTYQSPSGFYGVQGGVVKFSVPISGDPTFAGNLSSAYGTFGDVSIGSKLYSGMTAWGVGSGIWMENVGGVVKVAFGSSTEYMRWSPSAGLELKQNAFTVALSGTLSTAVANGHQVYGSKTATVTGGVAPFFYSWTLNGYTSANGLTVFYSISGGAGNIAGMNGTATNDNIVATITCTVTDSSSPARVATASFTHSVNHGTPP